MAVCGDSTFFHAGIPPLIDAVVQRIPFVLVILDNRTTAMTGMQEHPGTGRRLDHHPAVTGPDGWATISLPVEVGSGGILVAARRLA